MTLQEADQSVGLDYVAARLERLDKTDFSELGFDEDEGLTEYVETQLDLLSSVYEMTGDEKTTLYISSLIQSDPVELVEEVRNLEQGGNTESNDYEEPSALAKYVIAEGVN